MKKIRVKDVEVKVVDNYLIFNVDGKEVRLERKLGQSDYRIVYNYLKLKNPDKEPGIFSIGNFKYTLDENNYVSIWSKNYKFENVFKFEDNSENYRQHLRNRIITFLLENIE